MFTAAKLIAALFMGALGILVSEQIKPLLPEGADPGHMSLVNFCIGAVFGWRILGARAGRRTVDGINNGLTTVVVMVLVALFIQGMNEMLRRALLSYYDSPVEAMKVALDLGLRYGEYLLVPKIAGTLIGGAVLGGIVTEFVARRWR
ncbi:TrgA family protein [Shimia biformata]|uniref:TrgA family protein n=1 Tax=Shimia biformata TaxID=1294299 RepID=UPI0019506338|nr:TrgA family protein [Shimia biformata]